MKPVVHYYFGSTKTITRIIQDESSGYNVDTYVMSGNYPIELQVKTCANANAAIVDLCFRCHDMTPGQLLDIVNNEKYTHVWVFAHRSLIKVFHTSLFTKGFSDIMSQLQERIPTQEEFKIQRISIQTNVNKYLSVY